MFSVRFSVSLERFQCIQISQVSELLPYSLYFLRQVVASEEEREPPSEVQKPPRADGLADNLAEHVSNLAFQLALSNEERQVGSRTGCWDERIWLVFYLLSQVT